MPRRTEPTSSADLYDLPCACATARRAARTLTQLYDHHLRPHGIEGTQFALLEALETLGPRSQIAIGRGFRLDKTTLSRNLQLLTRKGWIEAMPGDDARERNYVLTVAGQKQLRAARPAWRRAQAELRGDMSADDWNAMWKGFRVVTDAADRVTQKRPAPRKAR